MSTLLLYRKCILIPQLDRWGLGKTDARTKSARGIPEWATVVEEVLDTLQIDQCSVMAHSAGAPYALAFANRFPERIRGEICLLAPWVGGGEGGESFHRNGVTVSLTEKHTLQQDTNGSSTCLMVS